MPRVRADQTTPWAVGSLRRLLLRGRLYIAGRSRAGKSNWLKWAILTVDTSATEEGPEFCIVYVNAHGEHSPGTYKVHSVAEIKRGLAAGHRKFNLYLPLRRIGLEALLAELKRLEEWVAQTGEKAMQGRASAPPWILVVFDEAHNYAPLNGAYGTVEAFLCEMAKFGARTIVASQRPQQVTSEALEQADVCVFYRCKIVGADYLTKKGIPYREFQDHVDPPEPTPETEYGWVIVDDGRWTPYSAVPNMDP